MWKKLLLNVLYNIAIFVCLATAYYGFQNGRYEFIIGATFIAVAFIILKIRLIKDVKNSQNKS